MATPSADNASPYAGSLVVSLQWRVKQFPNNQETNNSNDNKPKKVILSHVSTSQ
jgi:hypothetical protein